MAINIIMKIIIGIQCFLNFVVSILGFYPCLLLAGMILREPAAKGDLGAYIFAGFFGSLPFISLLAALAGLFFIKNKPEIAFLLNLLPFVQVITFFGYVAYLLLH